MKYIAIIETDEIKDFEFFEDVDGKYLVARDKNSESYEWIRLPFKKISELKNGTPLPKCKDCKHFEYDSVAKVGGIPLIVAHEICTRWGGGCKSKEDGYCYLFEAKAESEDKE